ncbi:hypothetical protein ACE6H2_009376 [Prunus campanulata]
MKGRENVGFTYNKVISSVVDKALDEELKWHGFESPEVEKATNDDEHEVTASDDDTRVRVFGDREIIDDLLHNSHDGGDTGKWWLGLLKGWL